MSLSISAPAPGQLPKLTRGEARRVLGLTRHPMDRLLDGGWLTTRVDHVAALAARGWISSTRPLVILRVGAARMDGDRPIGLDPRFSDDELLQACRQWWTCDPHAVVDAGHLLVTVSTFVVALLAITGIEAESIVITSGGATVKRWSFEADVVARVDDLVYGDTSVLGQPRNPQSDLIQALGNRVPAPQGAPLIIIAP